MSKVALAVILVVSLCAALAGTLVYSEFGETLHAWSHTVGVVCSGSCPLPAAIQAGEEGDCPLVKGEEADLGTCSEEELKAIRSIGRPEPGADASGAS